MKKGTTKRSLQPPTVAPAGTAETAAGAAETAAGAATRTTAVTSSARPSGGRDGWPGDRNMGTQGPLDAGRAGRSCQGLPGYQ